MDLYSRCMLCVIVHLLKVRNGHIKRITDGDIQSLVLELIGTNVRFVNIIPKLYTTVRLYLHNDKLEVTHATGCLRT